jgi:hypothetical protein
MIGMETGTRFVDDRSGFGGSCGTRKAEGAEQLTGKFLFRGAEGTALGMRRVQGVVVGCGLVIVAISIAGCGGGASGSSMASGTIAVASDTAVAALPVTAPTPATTATTTATIAAAAWTECAQEDETCMFSGTRSVKYGVDASSVIREFTGAAACDNATFGDPAVGQWKKCWYDGSTAASTVATNTTSAPTTTTTPATTNAPAPVGATSATFAGSTTDFLNPERGFYVTPADSEMNAATLQHFSDVYNTRLFLYIVRLDAYANTATLPQSFIDTLNARFAAGRAAGMKFVAFPAYNYSRGGDAPIDIVLQHIAQLGAVWAKNADVIPFLKAGYIGQWGEWHDSTNGLDSDANKLAIKNAILANTPSTTIVHFRTPSDVAKWYPNNPAAAAAARIGFHNDCYMANDTDAATFTGGLSDPLRAYAKTMAENSGFGGETCVGSDFLTNPASARISCAQALSEHPAYHMTWLNGSYAEEFMNSWKSGGCWDQISRSMGYRLQLDSVNHAPSASKGTAAAINVNLRNIGWARMFSKRALVVTLRNKSTGATITGSAGNLSTVASGASAQITVNVSIPAGAAAGTYDVLLGAPDIWSTTASDPRFAVRFANADSGAQAWDASAARFSTGTSISVQ